MQHLARHSALDVELTTLTFDSRNPCKETLGPPA